MINSTKDDLQQRAMVYSILAELWRKEPDRETFELFSNRKLRHLLGELGLNFPVNPDAKFFEVLAVDYCQLFIGPKNHIPTTQSVLEERTFQGNASESMKRYLGLLSEDLKTQIVDSGNEELDFFGNQLQLMSLFCWQSAENFESDKFKNLEELTTIFFKDHIFWATRFLGWAESKAKTDYYKNLIGLTLDFINTEFTELFAGVSVSEEIRVSE